MIDRTLISNQFGERGSHFQVPTATFAANVSYVSYISTESPCKQCCVAPKYSSFSFKPTNTRIYGFERSTEKRAYDYQCTTPESKEIYAAMGNAQPFGSTSNNGHRPVQMYWPPCLFSAAEDARGSRNQRLSMGQSRRSQVPFLQQAHPKASLIIST